MLSSPNLNLKIDIEYLLKQGKTANEIADDLGVKPKVVYDQARRMGVKIKRTSPK